MNRYLLDLNVLIALVDPAHVQHEEVHQWFGRAGRKSFATCPIAEDGLLRIVGHPKYPTRPGRRALSPARGPPSAPFPDMRSGPAALIA